MRSKRNGVYIVVTKGKYIGRLGMITRVCSHAWYAVTIFPDVIDNLHTSVFRLATDAEITSHLSAVTF